MLAPGRPAYGVSESSSALTRRSARLRKPSGAFKLADDARPGKYYASAERETIAGVGDCLAVKSKRVVVT
jgi:hypothetical protein